MKKSKFVLAIGLACIMGLTAMTCKNSQIQQTIKGDGVLITTVDTGMQVWKGYVTQHLSDGKVTQQQIDDVHMAYDSYYSAQQSAKAVIEMSLAPNSPNPDDVTAANAAVANAEGSLLNILNKYLNPTK